MRSIALIAITFAVQLISLHAAVETFIVNRGSKPARTTAAVDSKGVLHRGADYGSKPVPWLTDRTKSIAAKYPYMERMRHHTGSGVFRIFVDLYTGSVTNVVILKSTGFGRLDGSAVESLRQWRWRPRTWKQIDMPVTFTIAQPPTRVPADVERLSETR